MLVKQKVQGILLNLVIQYLIDQVRLDQIPQKGVIAAFSSTLNSHFDVWMQQMILDRVDVSY